MKSLALLSRRRALAMAAATVVGAPAWLLATGAEARQNAAMRKALQYQDKPRNGQACLDCVQFIAAKAPGAAGACNTIAYDTEIAPTGWCSAYVRKG